MSSASAPSPPASTPKFSIPASSAANWTNPSSAIFRPTPTLAAKTVSSTPSSSMGPFFILPSPFEREKLSTAMALCFAIYCHNSVAHPFRGEVSLWLCMSDRLPQNGGSNKMNTEISQKENLLYRTLLALALIVLAAALRIAPHPWNFTPIGAMALFSGALLTDRRLAFVFPLVALFEGDIVIGFHKLLPIVYGSFLINVAIGLWLRDRRTLARISLATLLGAIQFFFVTNFAVWWLLNSYPKTTSGLAACYLAGIPFFWNTLAGDAFYAALLFGAFAFAERVIPALREPAIARAR